MENISGVSAIGLEEGSQFPLPYEVPKPLSESPVTHEMDCIIDAIMSESDEEDEQMDVPLQMLKPDSEDTSTNLLTETHGLNLAPAHLQSTVPPTGTVDQHQTSSASAPAVPKAVDKIRS